MLSKVYCKSSRVCRSVKSSRLLSDFSVRNEIITKVLEIMNAVHWNITTTSLICASHSLHWICRCFFHNFFYSLSTAACREKFMQENYNCSSLQKRDRKISCETLLILFAITRRVSRNFVSCYFQTHFFSFIITPVAKVKTSLENCFLIVFMPAEYYSRRDDV